MEIAAEKMVRNS